jgi:diacylglycerol kinase (CTP)
MKSDALKFRTRFDDHLGRKVFHMLSGSVLTYLFVSELSRVQSVVLAFVGMMVVLPLDLLRLQWPALNKFAIKIYGPLMREGEEQRVSAQFYYALGIFWSVLVLPKTIAIQSILTLAWMDPAAALYGLRFGKNSWKKFLSSIFNIKNSPWINHLEHKSVEGSFAGFFAAFLAGVIAWTGPWAAYRIEGGLFWLPAIWVTLFSLIGAFVAMLAEMWPTQWDDNIGVPFWTGLIVWAVATVSGIPLSY